MIQPNDNCLLPLAENPEFLGIRTRRQFLGACTALGSGTLLGLPKPAAAEPPPEVKRIRLENGPYLCYAPLYVAEEFLRLEGFRDIEYVEGDFSKSENSTDIGIWGAPAVVRAVDEGMPVKVMSGLHAGCWELFGNDRVDGLQDLKGKTIAATGFRSIERIWISSILAYVGIDPHRDVKWVETGDLAESQRQFLADRVDAFLAFPPQPQEMRLAKAGHVLVNTIFDKPWSQYFCCTVAAHNNFIRKYPVAAKRALRAMLKAADVCADQPGKVARFLGAKGYETRYDIALEVVSQLPYRHWRDWNPEDTLRFHALRLKDVGMIKASPNELVARSADFRFLNELKREMKA
ncbi:MAG: ABC transporter substrate-binding protein [Burkholderiales bacterium]